MATKMVSLDEIYVDALKDLYSAENQLIKALPKMAKTAESSDLRKAFESHLKETQRQAERIERIFSDRGSGSPKGKKCAAMEGLIDEGKETMQEDMEPDVMDAALIGAAQKVEHYEIAGYGTARAWARLLGYEKAARLLEETLKEESAANEKLTQIAESHVNVEAR